MFTASIGQYWAQKALDAGSTEARGKQLRRDAFSLAQERYSKRLILFFPCKSSHRMICIVAYKPILRELEKNLAEAGLNEEEMRRSAAGPDVGGNRNRR